MLAAGLAPGFDIGLKAASEEPFLSPDAAGLLALEDDAGLEVVLEGPGGRLTSIFTGSELLLGAALLGAGFAAGLLPAAGAAPLLAGAGLLAVF